MLSDKLRKRLEEMNRRPLAEKPDVSPFRDRLLQAARTFDQRHSSVMPQMTIDEALGGREVETPAGQFYLVEPAPETLHAHIRHVAQQHADLLAAAGLPAFCEPIGADPARMLYLDIETTGFTGVPLFLIGLMHLDGDGFRMRQLLARDYSEEAALLEYMAALFTNFSCLVTFNGKTFDLPYIRDRLFANAVRCRFPENHLDLLAPSRRRWKTKLPDCRLQTLERWVCGRHRDGDIPGTDIPDTYHLFVRTGNAGLVQPILEHNALDLIAMGEVLTHLIKPDG